MTGSNRRPSACKADALPAELILHNVMICIGDPYGIRTRVTAVKGRCLNRLTNGPYRKLMAESKGFEPLRQGYPPTRFPIVLLRPLGQLSNMAPQVGLEPTTVRLTAECSTTELLRNNMVCLATSYSHRGRTPNYHRR